MAVAIVLVVLPVVMLVCPQAGRPGVNPHDSKPADTNKLAATQWGKFDWWCTGLLAVSLAALVTLLLLRIWWQPLAPASKTGAAGPGLLPGDSLIWTWLTLGMAALFIVAAALTALAYDKDPQWPGRPFRPFALGFMAPLTLGLAFVTGGIFAAGLNLLLPKLLIGTQFQSTAPAISGISWTAHPLRLPVPTYGFIFALLALAAMAVILAGVAVFWWGIRRWWKMKERSYLSIFYKGEGEQPKAEKRRHRIASSSIKALLPDKADRQRRRIAFSWTKALLPDYVGVAVTALCVAGIAAVAVFDLLALHPAFDSWLPVCAQVGQWLTLAAVVFLYGYTVQAFTDNGKRTQIGVLWDVGTFWPRASQPLAPPCYMERSVPETVNRLRRALGDEYRKDRDRGEFRDRNDRSEPTDPAADSAETGYIEEHIVGELGTEAAARIVLPEQEWVLINGYSQGAEIAAAVIAQLPQGLRDKVSLVTVGCQLRKLYGRAFPAYFGPRCLLDLAGKLSHPPGTDPEAATANVPAEAAGPDLDAATAKLLFEARWSNLIRPSDYLGSYVFQDTMGLNQNRTECYENGDCLVDKRLLDPPRIIPAHGTTPPPIHEHSDYWPDPQAALHTRIAVCEARLLAHYRLGNYCQALEDARELLIYCQEVLGADALATVAARGRVKELTARCNADGK
jgi:hypothetical protein